MLINLEVWTKFRVFDRFFELLSKYEPLYADQDLLNFILKDKIAILSQRFNCFSALDYDLHQRRA